MSTAYILKHPTGRPVPRATAPLARGEVIEIIMLARKAWEFQRAIGLVDEMPGLSDADAATEWRHQNQRSVFKLATLNDATQEQRQTILGYFALLAGLDTKAARHISRAGAGNAQRRLAEMKLRQICAKSGFDYPVYPEAICLRKHRKPLAEAHAGQLWALFYDCVNNARRKARDEAPPRTSTLDGDRNDRRSLNPEP